MIAAPAATLSIGSCSSMAAGVVSPIHQADKGTHLLLHLIPPPPPPNRFSSSNFKISCSSSSSCFNGGGGGGGGIGKLNIFSTSNRRRQLLSLKTSVAVESNNQLGSSSSSDDKEQPKKYYFIVANAKFMLDDEEHFQEQLVERLRLFEERNMEQDFWLVIEPKFLAKFPNITTRLGRPAVALVSTNGTWIKFMKLRLDRVLAESYEADSLEEALASNPTTIEFKKPEKWVAPYPKYETGWWEPFLLSGSQKPAAEA